MELVKEMEKFEGTLRRKKIPYAILNDQYINRYMFEHNGKRVSVINGLGTYGGYDLVNKYNMGFLEVMIGNDEPVGWLTAFHAEALIFNQERNEEETTHQEKAAEEETTHQEKAAEEETTKQEKHQNEEETTKSSETPEEEQCRFKRNGACTFEFSDMHNDFPSEHFCSDICDFKWIW